MWSTFEGVMGKEGEEVSGDGNGEIEKEGQGEEKEGKEGGGN